LDIAEGLNYLHANHTIHGNLNGAGVLFGSFLASPVTLDYPSILVGYDGHARLTDFELPSVARGMDSATQENRYTAAWTAPEILEGAYTVTREADIFAFGMVVIEVRCHHWY